RTATAVEVLWRGQRLRALASLPELIAAAPDGGGGYHLAVVRYGQLAAAGTARRGVPPMPVIDATSAGGHAVLSAAAPPGGAPAGWAVRWSRRPRSSRAGWSPRECASCGWPTTSGGPRRCDRPAPGRGGRRRPARRAWPPNRIRHRRRGAWTQICWLNRTQRA